MADLGIKKNDIRMEKEPDYCMDCNTLTQHRIKSKVLGVKCLKCGKER